MVIFTFASNLFFNVPEKGNSITKVNLELVSKELNHFWGPGTLTDDKKLSRNAI